MNIKLLLHFILLFILSSGIYSQNRISINAGYGYYLHNSENDLKIIGGKKFTSIFSYGVSYERENLFGIHLALNYNYSEQTKEKVIEFPYTGESGGDIIGSYGADLSLITHSIELSYVGNIYKNFSFGIGPSFLIINRILEIPDQRITVGQQTATLGIYDKLASSALGRNVFLMFSLPLSSDNKLFFTSKLKITYAHSIWFDEGMRKLDNYKQEFLTSDISAGIGYSF